MDPVLRVALAFALFAATHLALGAPRVRSALVARLGPQGFTLLFSLVAWLTFGLAISSYAAHAGEGPAGLALGADASGAARADRRHHAGRDADDGRLRPLLEIALRARRREGRRAARARARDPSPVLRGAGAVRRRARAARPAPGGRRRDGKPGLPRRLRRLVPGPQAARAPRRELPGLCRRHLGDSVRRDPGRAPAPGLGRASLRHAAARSRAQPRCCARSTRTCSTTAAPT